MMNKELEYRKNISIAIICISIMSYMLYICIQIKDIHIIMLSIIILIIIIFGIYEYDSCYNQYITNSVLRLSDMLAAIYDGPHSEEFSIMEDTLFSKVQMQAIKLIKLLQTKQKQNEDDKNEIKSLVSDIAHQLKTPLATLKLYSEFLRDDNITNEEHDKFLNILCNCLGRMEFLIESIIKMSRLESGVINLNITEHSLNDTIIKAIGQIHKNLCNKEIDIALEEVNKVVIPHDQNWTAEAIFNIIDNAVKYTPECGKIKIRIESYEIFTRIDVQDNGIGIKEDEIPKIFTRFYRGENAWDVEGAGIGLYITRKIVTMQGGYIKVKSNSSGSIFSIFLPNETVM